MILFNKFLLFLALAFPLSVFAGNATGNGGVGVVCNTNNNETSIELLDLYEAKNIYKFGNPQDNGSITKNLEKWNRDWSEAQGIAYDPHLYNIEKQITEIFVTVNSLPLSNDFSIWEPLPSNCYYIQIAKFIDPPLGTKPEDLWAKSKIEVVQELYEKLNTVNKAALLQHEFNYFAVRFLSNEQPLSWGSDEARIWVAAMATGNSSMLAPQYPNKLICDFPVNQEGGFIHHFYAQADSQNGVQGITFYFQWINGYVFPFKATAFIPLVNEQQLQLGKLTSPIEVDATVDIQMPGVTLRKIKIRIENSDDSENPIKIIPMDTNGNIIANGKCG